MSVFVGNRFTAVRAVKVAREAPDTTTLQFQCEMLTEWLTSSLILIHSFLSRLSVHHHVPLSCNPIPTAPGISRSLYPLYNSSGTGESPSSRRRRKTRLTVG